VHRESYVGLLNHLTDCCSSYTRCALLDNIHCVSLITPFLSYEEDVIYAHNCTSKTVNHTLFDHASASCPLALSISYRVFPPLSHGESWYPKESRRQAVISARLTHSNTYKPSLLGASSEVQKSCPLPVPRSPGSPIKVQEALGLQNFCWKSASQDSVSGGSCVRFVPIKAPAGDVRASVMPSFCWPALTW